MIRDLNFTAFEVIDGKLYYSNLLFNGLFCIDADGGKSEFLGFFPNEDINVEMLHRCAVEYDNKIYFIPYNAKYLSVYDVENGKLDSYALGKCNGKYIESYILKEKLWMIPDRIDNSFISFDLNKREIYEEQSIIHNISEIDKNRNGKFIHRTAVKESQIWFAIYGTSIIYCLDMNLNKVSTYTVNIPSICSVCMGLNCLWIIPTEGNCVYSAYINGDTIDMVRHVIQEEDENCRRLINYIFETDKYVVTLPAESDFFYLWDKKGTDGFARIFTISHTCESINEAITFNVMSLIAKKIKNTWYIPPIRYKKIILFNEIQGGFDEMKMDCLNDRRVIDIYSKSLMNRVQGEGKYMDLKTYMGYL